MIFTYYADTVDWIVEYLQEQFDKEPPLKPYRGRLVSVAGEETDLGIPRKEAVFGFAPRSSEAPAGFDEDQFDVMVTTDVLAEGMNLQDCRNIINYDLPWNPMRLVQRHGRIDRIGSLHSDVYIWCFFPDQRLEELLDLESRIRHKVAQAAASVGVEHEVIPGAATSDRVFAETVEEIERLKREDPTLLETAGERSGTQSGEAYRQELRKGLEKYGQEIENLPWGSGSGMAGSRPGHFFCARVGDRVFLRFVPLGVEAILRDSLACLRTISCTEATPRALSAEMRERAYRAWERARQDVFNEWQFLTDPANLQPKIRPLLRRAAELVRKHPTPGIPQEELDRIVDAIEAPWGNRIENQIREAMGGSTAAPQAAAQVIEAVKRLGLQPFQAPEPLPPIMPEDVTLICWLALESAATEA